MSWLIVAIRGVRAILKGPRGHVAAMAVALTVLVGCVAAIGKKPLSSVASAPECAVVVHTAAGPTSTGNRLPPFPARDRALERAWEQFLAEEAMKH